jgi:hypothetical protein
MTRAVEEENASGSLGRRKYSVKKIPRERSGPRVNQECVIGSVHFLFLLVNAGGRRSSLIAVRNTEMASWKLDLLH